MMRVLYLSHDGALDPLGRSQILPYLVRLSRSTVRVTLLSFEKPAALAQREDFAQTRAACTSAGVRWTHLQYHRWPPVIATLWDMARGLVCAWWIVQRERIEVVHARSYVAACLGVVLKRLTGARLVFDMRELWVDGRVDIGAWSRGGWLHRLGKWCERWCLRQSDAVVCLTHAGKEIVERFDRWTPKPPIVVIPTCVDIERFNHRVSPDNEPTPFQGRRVVVYLGSIVRYRFDAVVDCFKVATALWPNALLLVLTPQVDLARQICLQRGMASTQLEVRMVSHAEVPQYLWGAQVSLYLVTSSEATRSSCPTKLGESLAAGLPVMTNTGIGDQDALIPTHRVGVLVRAFTLEEYGRAWQEMLALLAEGESLRERCRAVARDQLGIDRGVQAYHRLYQQVCVG